MRAIRKSLKIKSLELVLTEGWENCLNKAALELQISPVSFI